MRYLQPLAIVLLLALAIADHWPSRDADAALPMSAYATKQGVCRMVSRLILHPPDSIQGQDLWYSIYGTHIILPLTQTCASLYR